MKIVLIITGLTMGGAETQVCALADNLVQQGDEVHIIVLAGEIQTLPKNNNVKIHRVNMKKNPLGLLKAILYSSKLIKEVGPDVVHSHMVHANIFARLLRVFIKIPKLISTVHSSNDGGYIRKIAYRATHFLANITTNVSHEAVKKFEDNRAVPKGGMLVQYNGVDMDYFHKRNSNDLIRNEFLIQPTTHVLLAIGRMTEAKDYPNLFQAISYMNLQHIVLLIAGTGPLESELKQLSYDMSLQDKIIFLGIRNDIPELMSAADLLVLSSEWEGLPMVIGEAISTECLVVTTDAGGSKEWFPKNLQHLVVPVKSPEILANKIDELLIQPLTISNAIKKQAKLFVQNKFSIKKTVSDWRALYSNIS